MGLWHGGSIGWVLWGVYHATGVAVFQAWDRFKRGRGMVTPAWLRPVAVLITVLFISGGQAFAATYPYGSGADAVAVFARLFGLSLGV